MKKSELIEKSDFTIVVVDKDGYMEFANEAECNALDKANSEDDGVETDEYISKFPKEVIKLMKRIKANDISAEEVEKEIEDIQSKNPDFTFCAIIGEMTIGSELDEKKSDDEKYIFIYNVTVEMDTVFANDIDRIKEDSDEYTCYDSTLVYNFRTGKIMGLSEGWCCVSPPRIHNFSHLQYTGFTKKLEEYEKMI